MIDGSGSVPSKDKGIKGKPSASRRLSGGLLKLTGGTRSRSKMIMLYNRSSNELESPMREKKRKKQQLWGLADLRNFRAFDFPPRCKCLILGFPP